MNQNEICKLRDSFRKLRYDRVNLSVWQIQMTPKVLRGLPRRIWRRLPESLRVSLPGQAYGRLLNARVRNRATRIQYFGTFFLRNRAELELMRCLVDRGALGSSLNIAILACSKGAEVYSILWTLRSARPDLKLTIHAVDISQEIIEFAQRGVYSRRSVDVSKAQSCESATEKKDANWNTWRDQDASIFERLTNSEMEAMFEMNGDLATVKPWLREGISWIRGDANDPQLADVLDHPEIVVANRFLCHMKPPAAESCLRNIGRLVKPGGYLFVSGIDLDVRTRVAYEMGWIPITDLIKEIHEGDPSLRKAWPLEYFGLEPFRDDRPDWKIRYASVFRIGETR
jgi:chemotaxis methyl-accepting protein methylase